MQVREIHRGFLIKGEPSACWEWVGNCNHAGYGRYLSGKYRVHRLARVLLGLGDPGDAQVNHRCDNPPCLRPSHTFLGDDAANRADMARKGRGVKSRFSRETIETIEREYASGKFTQRQLAEVYGVSPSHIGVITRRQLKSQRKDP
jgi:hypothetical protein